MPNWFDCDVTLFRERNWFTVGTFWKPKALFILGKYFDKMEILYFPLHSKTNEKYWFQENFNENLKKREKLSISANQLLSRNKKTVPVSFIHNWTCFLRVFPAMPLMYSESQQSRMKNWQVSWHNFSIKKICMNIDLFEPQLLCLVDFLSYFFFCCG